MSNKENSLFSNIGDDTLNSSFSVSDDSGRPPLPLSSPPKITKEGRKLRSRSSPRIDASFNRSGVRAQIFFTNMRPKVKIEPFEPKCLSKSAMDLFDSSIVTNQETVMDLEKDCNSSSPTKVDEIMPPQKCDDDDDSSHLVLEDKHKTQPLPLDSKIVEKMEVDEEKPEQDMMPMILPDTNPAEVEDENSLKQETREEEIILKKEIGDKIDLGSTVDCAVSEQAVLAFTDPQLNTDTFVTPIKTETNDSKEPEIKRRKSEREIKKVQKFFPPEEDDMKKVKKDAEKVAKTSVPKFTPEQLAEMEKGANFSDGDLVWAKLQKYKYPWWPAIVKRQEKSNMLVRIKKPGTREFHVVFFPDATWAWVPECDLRAFTGEEEVDGKKVEGRNKSEEHRLEVGVQRARVALQICNSGEQRLEHLHTVKGSSKHGTKYELKIMGPNWQPPLKVQKKRLKCPSLLSGKKRHLKTDDHGSSAKKSKIDPARISQIKTIENRAGSPSLRREQQLAKDLNDLLYDLPFCHNRKCLELISKTEERRKCTKCPKIFHSRCVTAASNFGDFFCKDCETDTHPCLLCNSATTSEGTQTISTCCWNWRHYHADCLEQFIRKDATLNKNYNQLKARKQLGGPAPLVPKCPSHYCHTCLIANSSDAGKGLISKCILCPIAYHLTEACAPPGCDIKNRQALICPRHFNKRSAYCPKQVINVDWCFECASEGKLLLCDECPVAFHIECAVKHGLCSGSADEETLKAAQFLCEDCKNGIYPKVNELVWVKYGSYKWWPSKVVSLKNAPENMERKRKSPGEFLVQFFGTGEFAYVSRGRVFQLFEDQLTHEKGNGNLMKNIEKKFEKAIVETKEYMRSLKAKEREIDPAEANTPPSLSLIKQNRPSAAVRELLGRGNGSGVLWMKGEDHTACSCNPDSKKNPHPCSEFSDPICQNRMMNFECQPSGPNECPAGDRCENQKFRKKQYANTLPFATNNRGWGLRSGEFGDIKKGSFVIEYQGELITKEEMKQRWEAKKTKRNQAFYYLDLGYKNIYIDAEYYGNNSHFINHSCEPNLALETWDVCGEKRIGLFALRDIKGGEELTFHYNFDTLEPGAKVECFCGTPSCLGFIQKRDYKYAKVKQLKDKEPKKKSSTAKRKSVKNKVATPNTSISAPVTSKESTAAVAAPQPTPLAPAEPDTLTPDVATESS